MRIIREREREMKATEKNEAEKEKRMKSTGIKQKWKNKHGSYQER